MNTKTILPIKIGTDCNVKDGIANNYMENAPAPYLGKLGVSLKWDAIRIKTNIDNEKNKEKPAA